MSNKAIVLDANILIRAVLGKRVRELVVAHAHDVRFFAPDGPKGKGQAKKKIVSKARRKPTEYACGPVLSKSMGFSIYRNNQRETSFV